MRRQDTNGPAAHRGFPWGLLAGIGLGAAAMYVLDPANGRRRRSLTRDKAVKARNTVEHAVTKEIPKRVDYLAGFAQGARHRVSVALGGGSDRRPENEHVLVDRVLSEVFRDPELSRSRVNVDANGTTVFLRGSIDELDTVHEIERRVRAVEGVDYVVNLINQPDADPSEVRVP